MNKRCVVLLGMLLSSSAPVAAQTPAAPIVPAEERVAPIITMLRTVPTPSSPPSFRLSQDHGQSPARSSLLFAGAFERAHSLELFPPGEEVKNLVHTLSSLPLVQLWGGSLQLDALQSTLHSQDLQLGPLGYGGMQGFHGYPGGPRTARIGLSFHFGRDGGTERPTQALRSLSRIVGTVFD